MKQIVLMYHDIIDHDVAESGFQNNTALKYKVSSKNFEEQVRRIREYIDNNKLPDQAVGFTFDDGGESFLTVAAPVLEKYGFRGLFFIATGYIGAKGFLNADQIKELAARGHKVGSHSHSHPERMTILSTQTIKDEWETSQMLLGEVLGYKPDAASIPNGYSSPAVVNAMADTGINEIYTSRPSTKVKKQSNHIIIGRYAVTDEMTTEAVLSIVSSSFKRLKIGLKQSILDLAKIVLGDYYLSIRKKLIKKPEML